MMAMIFRILPLPGFFMSRGRTTGGLHDTRFDSFSRAASGASANTEART
jgi:hypothetical protein